MLTRFCQSKSHRDPLCNSHLLLTPWLNEPNACVEISSKCWCIPIEYHEQNYEKFDSSIYKHEKMDNYICDLNLLLNIHGTMSTNLVIFRDGKGQKVLDWVRFKVSEENSGFFVSIMKLSTKQCCCKSCCQTYFIGEQLTAGLSL